MSLTRSPSDNKSDEGGDMPLFSSHTSEVDNRNAIAGNTTYDEGDLYSESRQEEVGPHKLRESERFVFFTDAVLAIATTLLILPLMEAATTVGDNDSEGTPGETSTDKDGAGTTADFFHLHGDQVLAFVLSFAWVFRIGWQPHAFLFAHVQLLSPAILAVNFAWMLSVVFFPVASSLLLGSEGATTSGYATYFGTLWLIVVFLMLTKFLIRRDPRTWSKQYGGPTFYSLVKSIITVILATIALVVAVTVPTNGWAAVFIFVLIRPTVFAVVKCWPGLEKSSTDKLYEHLETNFVKEIWHYVCRKMMSCLIENEEKEAPDSQCGRAEKDSQVKDEARRENALFNSEQREMTVAAHRRLVNRSLLLGFSERLIVYTDAICAISLTLLIIPLMEKSSERDWATVSEFFAENSKMMGVFILSFFVVASSWLRHDQLFSFIKGCVPAEFLVFTLPWLLSITFMPVANELKAINDNDSDRSKYAVYLGTITFNRLIEAAMTFIVFRQDVDLRFGSVVESIVAIVLSATALLIAMLVPGAGLYMTLLVFLAWPITFLLVRVWPNLDKVVDKLT